MFMLQGIEETARETTSLIYAIRDSIQTTKVKIRQSAPKIYSQDLINTIYSYPYTKIKYIAESCYVSPQTAGRYLEQLVDMNILSMSKHGRENYYLNDTLVQILITNQKR